MLLFRGQLSAARCRQAVELYAPVRGGQAPLGRDPAESFDAMESGVQRALLNAQDVIGDLLDVTRDGIAVHGCAGRERLQDQKVQRALEVVRS
jgi:hypothetical protein